MGLKSFFAGIIGGILFIGSLMYGEMLLAIPPLVATALIALFGWFFKHNYENYINEIQALKRAETVLITNLNKNSHNADFFGAWRKSLKANTLYSVVFREYVPITDFDKIVDSELYNCFAKLNVCYEGLGLDLKNFYESYESGSKEMLFGEHVKEWYGMNANMLQQTETFEQNFQNAEEDTIAAIATLRCYFKQLRFSFFRILKMLGTGVYPFKNSDLLEQEIQDLKRQLSVSKEE